ncbi:MAG TPA: hypothetical protein VFC78_11215 [Tepidisphaeraceae bacterium]|nr:hypothetical protein [Tepidisphaeraceae bacterium]
MSKTIALDEAHFSILEEKARGLGKTPGQYVEALIDADSQSFDEILQPVRNGFKHMGDEELDALLQRAQSAGYQLNEYRP